jgi:hypothetical protein
MPATFRTTSSGACCSCGAYGGSQHRPTCRPDGPPPYRIKLQRSRQARRDRRTSWVVRENERIQHELIGDL